MASEHKRSGWRMWAVWLAGLLVLYVLSIGPVHALVFRFGGVEELLVVETIYAPVILPSDHVGAEELLYGWLRWWDDLLSR